ncbi:MAG: ABC transporter substrate-binding protein [Gammaproteobacteria bacterium]|nr:ABC transporter substrate-binding protein [Gammaproteobacteria bacterium]
MTSPLTDAAGVVHRPAGPAARIVSLVPSLTELIFDLGLADQLVGRTRFCIHPRAGVADIARVGGTKDVRMDRLRALAPTHVIVNVDENTRAAAEEIARCVPNVIVTHPLGPRDNPPLYRLLGGIFGREAAAERLCTAFEHALDALRERAAALPAQRVLYLIWRDPWMTVGRDTYIARMLELVGWHTVGDVAGQRYPRVVPGRALLHETDLVLFSSEPFCFADAHLEELRCLAGSDLPRFARVDGEMISWYGSRAIRALDYLGELAARTLACAA